MDRRERYDDQHEALRAIQDGAQAQIWTALPGIIQSFDPAKVTAEVQPAMKGRITDQNGKVTTPDLPMLVDVPVVFPRGGGYTLTFPVQAGDECLIVFGSRCMDGWWQDGGSQPALDMRMHDLSDGFAIVGPQSQKKTIKAISTSSTQLRSDDGSTSIDLKDGLVTVKSLSVVVDAPLTTFTGQVVMDQTLVVTGTVTGAGIGLSTHHHTGVQSGPSISGVPVP